MLAQLKTLYSHAKDSIDVIAFLFMLPNLFFHKSSLVFRKKTVGSISILGNGPSAHETYENKNTESLLCVNYFALTDRFFDYKPDYYMIIDPLFFIYMDSGSNCELIEVLNSVDWKMNLIIPSKYKPQILKFIKNNNLNILYLRSNYLPGSNCLVYKFYLKNFATPRFQNVIVAAIYSAINIGFNKISLHGVEANEFSNFSITKHNEVVLHAVHSYGSANRNMTKEGLVKKGEFWRHLGYYSLMFRGFSQVASYAEYLNVDVLNYTEDSFIDSFRKE